ncbi:MAG TPA: pyridoxamine 5'-phosphate oxidase family protein [Solirubrobacteraceae bacterium]|jgi:PPOX class probable F420-dependent enzyme|nr:pyridoxamine 5'-phosphate oxidase family protein [Solirubrobacteraceae bacterium]
MSRRDQIKLSDEEIAQFLEQQRTVICATNGVHGWPHLMPLWYLVRDGELWAWTYAKSQKVRNLERDPRATLQVEEGEQYAELRGVMIEAETKLHTDTDDVLEFGLKLFERYGGGATGPEFVETVRKQAAKRVVLQFVPKRVTSWDHRKLGGIY